MIKTIFTIFDEKSGVYSDPYTSINEETAIRDFTYACTQEESSNLNRFTIDFHLFQLANYDDQEGTFTINKKLLLSGSQLLPLKTKLQTEKLKQLQQINNPTEESHNA